MAAPRRTKQLTLLLLHSGGRLLLGLKKRGFGIGKLNGFGGKLEPGETLLRGALREMREESCVEATDAALRGHIVFEFEDATADRLEVHVFRATAFTGEPRETEEMAPAWHDAAAPPFERMWLDDRHWLPLLLSGERFDAHFLFRGHEEILRHEVRVLGAGEALPYGEEAVLVSEAQGAIEAGSG